MPLPFSVYASEDLMKTFKFAIYVGQLSTGLTVEVNAESEEKARKQIKLVKLTRPVRSSWHRRCVHSSMKGGDG